MYIFIAIINAVAFILFCIDKLLAVLNKRRISERTLLIFAFCFGAFGAVCAMFLTRHKIRKYSFCVPVYLMLILQIAVIMFHLVYN